MKRGGLNGVYHRDRSCDPFYLAETPALVYEAIADEEFALLNKVVAEED